jgi:hypothetical protein
VHRYWVHPFLHEGVGILPGSPRIRTSVTAQAFLVLEHPVTDISSPGSGKSLENLVLLSAGMAHNAERSGNMQGIQSG